MPTKPANDSGLSEFEKMRIGLLKQKKMIPDIVITIVDNKYEKYKDLFGGVFYEIGIVRNDRAVYMNYNKIYVFYVINNWCIGSVYNKAKKEAIICWNSKALSPELMDTMKDIKFRNVAFRPAYFSIIR